MKVFTSGSGTHTSLQGAVVPEGHTARSLQFNGMAGIVITAMAPQVKKETHDSGAPLSVESWVFRTGSGVGPNRQSILFDFGGGYLLGIDCWGVVMVFYRTDKDWMVRYSRAQQNSFEHISFCDGEHAVPPHVWTHIAVVAGYGMGVDGVHTQFHLHVNGVRRSTVYVPLRVHMYPALHLGMSSIQNFAEPFEGNVDEVRVWRGTRTVEEIAETWNRSLTAAEINDVRLLTYWDFDAYEATVKGKYGENGLGRKPIEDMVVLDRSGHGNDGLLHGEYDGARHIGDSLLPVFTTFVPSLMLNNWKNNGT